MKEKNVCNGLNFADCELAILRIAVDKAEEKIGKRVVKSDDIQKIIQIVENFIKRKNLICYGGTAINNILPTEDQFYNKEAEIPDYDFFTPNALHDAKELADIYYKEGFTDVEAKSGQHHGTYKVFVNYIPVADITFLDKGIYDTLKKDAIRVGGILYAPPNFLRMSMYLELSRPAGDTSRWEKVLKRLTLLNKNFPLSHINCNNVEFQREMDNTQKENDIYNNVRNTFIHQGVVFFGGYTVSMYSQYMPNKEKKRLEKIADFDVLSNDPETTAQIVKERLKDINVTNTKIIKREKVGEIIPEHYEVKVGNETIAFIYKPIGCHSYNVINLHGEKVRIASIDTMLSFYFAFLYANRPYYNDFLERNLCIAKLLFEVQQKNRLKQKGILKRFSILCYGHQESLEEMRADRAKKYKELKQKGNIAEFEEWFLNYTPEKIYNSNNKNPTNKKSTNKNPTNKKSTNKNLTNKKSTNKKVKKSSSLNIYGRKTKKNRKGFFY